MEIITGTGLQRLVDYDFGDHMGHASIPKPVGGFMKEANALNVEFLNKCKDFEGKIMTLFIDNIRLYARPVVTTSENDKNWIVYLHARNDLLSICEQLPNNKFIIFTSHEDTPIDSMIVLPSNVLNIYAVNAKFNNDKIHPFPYGLQREMPNDKRLEIMKELVEKDEPQIPTKLLYINCGLGHERNNPERAYLINFEGLPWTTCRFDKDSKYFPYNKYRDFLKELKDHKFMICPEGHGMDCHRNWETLYMRRVPVMKKSPYFSRLMDGFPVLYVDQWSDINEQLLYDADHLFKEAQAMDMEKLNLNKIFNKIVHENNNK